MSINSQHTCPVCGWGELNVPPYESYAGPSASQKLTPPYEDVLGLASYEVCLCCGFEFGNDDNPGIAEPRSFENYREEWANSGARWFDETARPVDWNLDEQLKRIQN